ncbi:hypothetical protein DL93DRAFT_2173055 [Clavulina sp. PMI_390]|nr:hypothetical protein DL93DRAFT_2173055 [Clavulina sp. PMI_390]
MPDFDVVDSYRGGHADDDFDLPRFQPRAAQRDMRPPTNNTYGHNMASPNGPRINPSYTGTSNLGAMASYAPPPGDSSPGFGNGAQRQHPASRLSQILDVDVFGGASNLARSTSLGGVSRARHGGQPPDDVERAFADLPTSNPRIAGPPMQPQQSPPSQQSFYNPSIYQNPSSTSLDSSRSPPSDQLPYPTRRATTQQIPQSTGTYVESAYSSAPSPYEPYSHSTSEAHRSPHSHGSSPPTSLPPPSGSVPLQQSPSITQSYHPSISAAFSTPPPSSQPPPDASSSLRPYPYSSQQYRPPGGTASNPATPAYPSRHQSPQMYGYGESNGSRPMSIDGRGAPLHSQPPPPPPPAPKPAGLRRVNGPADLNPRVNPHPTNRRADPSGNGQFLSPLKCLTSQLAQTYNICNPDFRYESQHNPRRVLTKPSKPVHNDGYDNEDYDYILYVNDCLGTEEGQNKYLILDVLGQGTFGQVVKCQNMKTHEIVAVKVVKNKPAYFNQSMMEVTILDLLNKTWDANDEHHILRLRDTFIHKAHLCLVFELLSSNLYELIKQNSFGGLSTQLVKVFTAQLLDALTILNEAKLIHCDLKPENILLKSLQSPEIKIIDFGSACHERQTVYTYIQSRFYRSPEVLLGLSYNSAIDMWSLGCIAVELFLGLPLFPGTSEYNQITRIVEMMGMPPAFMLEMGKQTTNFFSTYTDEYNRKRYRLKSLEQYSREHGTNEQPGKKYFTANTLPEIIRTAPQPKSASKPADFEKEAQNRAAFIDFVQGLLNLNPIERWSPQQARLHPFITGEKFTRPYVPADVLAARNASQPPPAAPPATSNPKQPYGGLVASQPKGTRAYADAATYNAHLNQHQSYTAQAASQAAQQPIRNPYITPPQTQQPPPPSHTQSQPLPAQAAYDRSAPPTTAPDLSSQYITQPPRLHHQASASALNTTSYNQQSPIHTQQQSQQQQQQSPYANPNPPSSSYYPQSRARANTINQMDHAVPPQIARIATLGMEVSGIKRNTLTPVLNREEAIKEWERRASGQRPPPASYPQLEYLQQQAELSSANWAGAGGNSRRYHPPSNLQHFQSPPSALTVDSSSGKHHRELSNAGAVRDLNMGGLPTARSSGSTNYDPISHANLPPAPPQAYTAGSSSRYGGSAQAPPMQQQSSSSYTSSYQSPSTNNYQGTSSSNATSSSMPYDAYDHRDGLGTLYTPMQPQILSGSSTQLSQQQNQYSSGSSGNAMTSAASFYGGGVVPPSSQQGQQPMVNLPANAQRPQPQSGQQSSHSILPDPWAR